MKFVVVFSLMLPFAVSAAMTVESLQCEYQQDPVGIAIAKPRFSWTLKESEESVRGQRQSGYRLRVAESVEALQGGGPLVWEEGACDSAMNVIYAGRPLASGTPYYWQVQARDYAGKETPWSAPARFSVALQSAAEWGRAQWLIEPQDGMPNWENFRLVARFKVKEGGCGLIFRAPDANNCLLWAFSTTQRTGHLVFCPRVCKAGVWVSLPMVDITAKYPELGDPANAHIVTVDVNGSLLHTRIDGVEISNLEDHTFTFGTIGFRAGAGESGSLDEIQVRDMTGAVVFRELFDNPATCAFTGEKPRNGWLEVSGKTVLLGTEKPKNCPRFRKGFSLPRKTIRHAYASVCGLGFYELYLNGQKVNDHLQTSLNTDYAKRLLFDTIDVTRFLKAGSNTVGLWLAPGYSDDYSKWGWKWESAKRVIAHIRVVYTDGTKREIVTDGSWQATAKSPISYASLYQGERYQAGAEDPQWSTAAGRSEGWKRAYEVPAPLVPLVPNPGVAVRVVETNPPCSITEPQPGVFVADFGQNRAGFVRIRARGARNATFQIRHSELLGTNGLIDPWTNRKAENLDEVTLLGTNAWEVYQPRFTYHGFRYAQITGYPGRPMVEDLLGCAVHADVERTASFHSSAGVLSQLFSAAGWSMLSNLQGIPTDCCMRDERTPCQMDSQAYEDAALACFNLKPFYTKWLGDIAGSTGNPDWNGDAVTLPWRLYQDTGDRRFLADHYANMVKVTDAVTAAYPDGICTNGFGDWCAPNDGTWAGFHGHVALVNTAIYASMADILAASARLLGNEVDVMKYTALRERIRAAFQATFFHPETGAYDDGSQTAQILPLAFGLVPEMYRRAAVAKLVKTIREKDRCHLDTGIFGTRYLADVLCDAGEDDLAITLLTQPAYPGFGYEFAKGATTLWEQWREKGGMNSHNHAMFAGVVSSLLTRLGGIRADAPGYRVIGIHPSFPAQVNDVEVTRDTPVGRVVCHWMRFGMSYGIELSIPVNGSAVFSLPFSRREITENGVPLEQAPGVAYLGEKDGRIQFALGSGEYRFQINR